MGNGEFEGQSLESLHAMLAGSDPAKLANAGNALSDAAPKITEVGNYLRSHATRVEWRGEGADSFREWSHHFALEVMRLGEFTGAVGNHMVNAGQALTEAKAAVPKPVDAEKAHGDPDADKAHIADGTTKLQQAIHQMERLSSYYRAAKEDIAAEREPEFKELPAIGGKASTLTPIAEQGTSGRSESAVSVRPQAISVAEAGGHATGSLAGEALGGKPGGVGGGSGLSGLSHVSPQGREAAFDPSSKGPLEQLPSMALANTTPVKEPTDSKLLSAPPLPDAPAPNRSVDGPFPDLMPRPSPPIAEGDRHLSAQTGRAVPRSSRGLVAGEERAPLVRAPGLGSTPDLGRPSAVRDTPLENRGPTGIPRAQEPGTGVRAQRGLVVGEESHASPRGGFPGAVGGMASGNPGVGRSASGARSGAGLATEPGGVAADGRAGAQRSAGFTPGGAGLVRGGGVGPTAQRRDRQSVQPRRAGGAGEFDQWPLGRDTVPPVIE